MNKKIKPSTIIQIGKFKDKIDEVTCTDDVFGIYRIDMSEFEWGARPESRDRMVENSDSYKIIEFPEYIDADGKALKVFTDFEKEEIQENIKKLVESDRGLVNPAGLCSKIQKETEELSDYDKRIKEAYEVVDFWWDLENDFFMLYL
jgi:hypothetical protein